MPIFEFRSLLGLQLKWISSAWEWDCFGTKLPSDPDHNRIKSAQVCRRLPSRKKKFQWRLTRYPGSNFFARFFSVLTAWYGPGLNTTFFAAHVFSSTLVALESRGSLFKTESFSGVFSAFPSRCNSKAVFVCVSASF